MPTLVYSERIERAEMVERTDRELLQAIQARDEVALDELIGRKTGPLLQLAYRILGDLEEARDVVQVAFFRVWESADRFDNRFSPNTWIYRIVNNLAIDQLRSRRSRERCAEPVRQHIQGLAEARGDRQLSSLGGGEVMDIFRDLAGELTEKQRSVFILRELEERSSREVADILGCRESTVRNHLFNARKVLRKALVERYPEYAPDDSNGASSNSSGGAS